MNPPDDAYETPPSLLAPETPLPPPSTGPASGHQRSPTITLSQPVYAQILLFEGSSKPDTVVAS